jgi:hypothetical protein
MYSLDDDLEDHYIAWLDENCKCNLEEDGCNCLSMDKWYREECMSHYSLFDGAELA